MSSGLNRAFSTQEKALVGIISENCKYLCKNCQTLVLGDGAVAVVVKHSEDAGKDILGGALGHDVEDGHELGEVNVPVTVGVIHPEPGIITQGGIFCA